MKKIIKREVLWDFDPIETVFSENHRHGRLEDWIYEIDGSFWCLPGVLIHPVEGAVIEDDDLELVEMERQEVVTTVWLPK